MLFSLTCPERVSALTKLDLRHCHILPESVEFILLPLVKEAQLINYHRVSSHVSLPSPSCVRWRHYLAT